MFLTAAMQMDFGFDRRGDLAGIRDRLMAYFGCPGPIVRRTPIGQLVKSSISGRTRDDVSLAAYGSLVTRYRTWDELARATPAEVDAVIGDVTFPDVKARHLVAALRAIATSHPDFDLRILGQLRVAEALGWLERLPGVGRKVAASTLNFSTLRMPAFVVDTHILRIVCRLGLARRKADAVAAYEEIMALADGWSAVDLAELHIWMKRLGQTVCRPERAGCQHCPIRADCRTAARSADDAPTRAFSV